MSSSPFRLSYERAPRARRKKTAIDFASSQQIEFVQLLLVAPRESERHEPPRAIALARHIALPVLERLIQQVLQVELRRDHGAERYARREVEHVARLLVRVGQR